MRVADIGEFGLIDRLAAMVGADCDEALVMGIGDDAAAWKPTPGCILATTTDALVEDVHFSLHTTGWEDLGWKALAENISDIAAMGCQPRYALVALAVPPEALVTDVEALYRGLQACAQAYGCRVIGGDTIRAPQVVISVTVVGESGPGNGEPPLLTRSAARAGDLVAVTGPLGASAAGLRLLTEHAYLSPDDAPLVAAHRRPVPRVAAGTALVEAGIRCAIDVSDGLLADLGHICERSGCDAEVDVRRVPVHPAARERFGEAALELALSGGEDYELVCTGPQDRVHAANARLLERGEPQLTVIGAMAPPQGPRPGVWLRYPEERRRVERGGYQHFGDGR